MIRRTITLTLMAMSFWGGIKFQRAQSASACLGAGGSMVTPNLCTGAQP